MSANCSIASPFTSTERQCDDDHTGAPITGDKAPRGYPGGAAAWGFARPGLAEGSAWCEYAEALQSEIIGVSEKAVKPHSSHHPSPISKAIPQKTPSSSSPAAMSSVISTPTSSSSGSARQALHWVIWFSRLFQVQGFPDRLFVLPHGAFSGSDIATSPVG